MNEEMESQSCRLEETGAADRDFPAPRTPAEELIGAIWSCVLGVERVGIYDDFFELGGDSQSAARVISKIGEVFRKDLRLPCLFRSPTVVGLVNLLAEMWDGREIIDEIAWTVMQVEQLSDDEVEKLLTRIA